MYYDTIILHGVALLLPCTVVSLVPISHIYFKLNAVPCHKIHFLGSLVFSIVYNIKDSDMFNDLKDDFSSTSRMVTWKGRPPFFPLICIFEAGLPISG